MGGRLVAGDRTVLRGGCDGGGVEGGVGCGSGGGGGGRHTLRGHRACGMYRCLTRVTHTRGGGDLVGGNGQFAGRTQPVSRSRGDGSWTDGSILGRID